MKLNEIKSIKLVQGLWGNRIYGSSSLFLHIFRFLPLSALPPALHWLRPHSGAFVWFFFFPSLLLVRGREEAASPACQVETRGIKWPLSPFLPQRAGVSHVSSPARPVSTAQLSKPRTRLKATGPGVGDRPKWPQSRQRPGPQCS